MTKNNYLWFIRLWLLHWERKSISSRWNKARAVFRQNQVTNLDIRKGAIVSKVGGSENHSVEIQTVPVADGEIRMIVQSFRQHPDLVSKLYLRSLTEEEAGRFPHSLGFQIPLTTRAICHCGDHGDPCVHVLATVWAAAEKCNGDPVQFLLLNGIPWGEILDGYGEEGKAPLEPSPSLEGYKLVPIPEKKSAGGEKKRILVTPPFWTSPFPYLLIMQEIYSKVMEEARKSSR
ncbi:hypothetical protein [Ammoniphilus sp. 3BR4]|uniref:hypothetical protein n=1 Tax=Ammoniphilus sp. 3BR4 TaxID=3158265 RepID=UPI003466C4F5